MPEWVEILWGFTKFFFKQMLKVSVFYLEKQKSFIHKKKKIKPLSISKQKSFVYCLNFPEGFGVEFVQDLNSSTTLTDNKGQKNSRVRKGFMVIFWKIWKLDNLLLKAYGRNRKIVLVRFWKMWRLDNLLLYFSDL